LFVRRNGAVLAATKPIREKPNLTARFWKFLIPPLKISFSLRKSLGNVSRTFFVCKFYWNLL
jgi:hypothetical protein